MNSSKEIKNMVKEKYSEVLKKQDGGSCCEPKYCGDSGDVTFNLDYKNLPGYNKEADFQLGCGIPTGAVEIKEGATVLDLGSGAGNDVFVARSYVGETGKVIGVDMTEAMIEKANANKAKAGYTNVEFRQGEIEELPVVDNSVDVVISNCVLNLVPDKAKAFSEIYRVTKPGGSFSVSDIVLEESLNEKLSRLASLYAGCVSGAILKSDYLSIIQNSGFTDVKVFSETNKTFSKDVLKQFLTEEEFSKVEVEEISVLSITVTGRKPI